MRSKSNSKRHLNTPLTGVVLALLLSASASTQARGLRQIQPVPSAPAVSEGLQQAIQLNSRGTAAKDLERLLQNSLLVRSAESNSATLSLSEQPTHSSLSILLRSRPAPDRTRVTQALERTLQAWGTPQLQALLSTGYYDANRLQNNLINNIPTDARLELLRLEDFRIINDNIITTDNNELARVWLVVADAITQVELNDPIAGFVSLRGKQRYTLHLFDLAALSSAATPLSPTPLRETFQ